jgi:hypothetical protein
MITGTPRRLTAGVPNFALLSTGDKHTQAVRSSRPAAAAERHRMPSSMSRIWQQRFSYAGRDCRGAEILRSGAVPVGEYYGSYTDTAVIPNLAAICGWRAQRR